MIVAQASEPYFLLWSLGKFLFQKSPALANRRYSQFTFVSDRSCGLYNERFLSIKQSFCVLSLFIELRCKSRIFPLQETHLAQLCFRANTQKFVGNCFIHRVFSIGQELMFMFQNIHRQYILSFRCRNGGVEEKPTAYLRLP